MISQFHILSPRGDCITTRDFRDNAPTGTADIFFRKVKFWEGGAPPVFSVDKVHYVFVYKSGIYFVLTSLSPLEPCWGVDLLNKLIKSLKDFCGVLSEESLRRNFIMVYELIDEVIDCGYPQTTASETLRIAVHSDPVQVSASTTSLAGSIPNALAMIPQLRGVVGTSSTVPSSANQRPIGAPVVSASQTSIAGLTLPGNIKLPSLGVPDVTSTLKNEIFVDIIEKVSVVVARSGEIVNASIDGSIQMKSYLSGNPSLRLALNEDLAIATEERAVPVSSSSSLVLDDTLFHESANLTEFESSRIISLTPPDGEFVLMNYRISSFQKLPFRVYYSQSISGDRLDVSVSVRADLPPQNYGSNVIVSLPLMGPVRGVSCGESGEFLAHENRIAWTLKKISGQSECVCRAKIHLAESGAVDLTGPVSLSFEVPMYSLSNMQVKYLRIGESSGFGGRGLSGSGSPSSNGPFRWVRYVTQSKSYSVRH